MTIVKMRQYQCIINGSGYICCVLFRKFKTPINCSGHFARNIIIIIIRFSLSVRPRKLKDFTLSMAELLIKIVTVHYCMMETFRQNVLKKYCFRISKND